MRRVALGMSPSVNPFRLHAWPERPAKKAKKCKTNAVDDMAKLVFADLNCESITTSDLTLDRVKTHMQNVGLSIRTCCVSSMVCSFLRTIAAIAGTRRWHSRAVGCPSCYVLVSETLRGRALDVGQFVLRCQISHSLTCKRWC